MKLGIHYQLSPIAPLFNTAEIFNIEKIVKEDLKRIREAGISLLRLDSDHFDFLFNICSFAKKLGFEIWLGPKFHRQDPMLSKEEFLKVAEKFALEANHQKVDVFVIGNELSLELKDFALIQEYQNRGLNWSTFIKEFDERRNKFQEFIGYLAQKSKERFGGLITYAAGIWELENIDWQYMDIVSSNLYLWKYCTEKEYSAYLEKLKAVDKKVAVTEFGFLTIKEAFDFGPAFTVLTQGGFHYDENTQAKLIKKNIALLRQADIDYAFLHQLRERYDAGFGIVKSDGTPKKSFYVLRRLVKRLEEKNCIGVISEILSNLLRRKHK